MGLPIWRDPEEKKAAKDALNTDPTAASRSSIRRRPSVHGRRSDRPRPPRDDTVRAAHSRTSRPLPSTDSPWLDAVWPSGNGGSGVPPISTLLESADRAAPPPPPVPESRNFHTRRQVTRGMRSDLDDMRNEVASLQRQARDISNLIRASGAALPDWETAVSAERSTLRGENAQSLEDVVDRLESVSGQIDRLGRPSNTAARSPIHESPEPMERPQSRGQAAARRNTLPTPPLDHSEDGESLFLPNPANLRRASNRRSHPLSRSWRPDSQVDGLGDRNISPTPTNGWEIMRSTIAPDANLPSADSSFTSAAASNSFTSNADTTITEPESSDNGRRDSTDDVASDSASSVDPDDACNDDNMIDATEQLARDMYFTEMETPEGRERIAVQQQIRDREGNRFALSDEPAGVDIGFRLIEDALSTDDGRLRVERLQAHTGTADVERMVRFRDIVHGRNSGADGPLSPPRPERYGQNVHDTAQRTRHDVHNYFDRATSPPSYTPVRFHTSVNAFTSRDGPEPHPVSPPNARGEREVGDAMLSDLGGDEQDLGAMRRVVERLARDDVPEEWWMSMGLNLSRTRPRTQTARRSADRPVPAVGERVRGGRVGRSNSWL